MAFDKRSRKPKKEQGATKASFSNSQGIMTNVTNALQSHPTIGMPTTPIIGGRLGKATEFNGQDNVPGYLLAKYVPVLGSTWGAEQNATLKNVARNLWSSMRNFCTTAINYQPNDVQLVLIQLSMFPSMMAEILRQMKAVYFADTTHNYYNRYMYDVCAGYPVPEANRLVEIREMPNHVSRYNAIVQLFNSIAPPDMFPIFHRWEYLNSRVFTDVDLTADNGAKTAQYIIFEPTVWYKTSFADLQVPANRLVPEYWISANISDRLTKVEELLFEMFEDSNVRLILGDLYQTFGNDNKYMMSEVNLEQIKDFPLEYNFEVLFTLHHATVVPIPAPSIIASTETGLLEATYALSATGQALAMESAFIACPKIFNQTTYKGMSTDDFLKYTQWMISESNYNNELGLKNPGPEIIASLEIFDFEFAASSGSVRLRSASRQMNCTGLIENSSLNWTNAQIIFTWQGKIQNFAWSPIWYNCSYKWSDGVLSDWSVLSYCEELEVPVLLRDDVLDKWHEALTQAVWNTPVDIIFKTH